MVEIYLERNTTPDGQIAVSADRARSLFSEYAASKCGAAENTFATNHAASAIASAAFDTVVKSGALQGEEAVFVAGGPGVGKSSAQAAYPEDAPMVKLWYEGNLSNAELLRTRVKAVQHGGGRVTIVFIYAPPRLTLERQIARANEIGRCVPISYGARVAADTPGSIEALYRSVGDSVGYIAIDNSRTPDAAAAEAGIDAILKLANNRSSEEIRHEQLEHAKNLHAAGQLDDQLYERLTRDLLEESG